MMPLLYCLDFGVWASWCSRVGCCCCLAVVTAAVCLLGKLIVAKGFFFLFLQWSLFHYGPSGIWSVVLNLVCCLGFSNDVVCSVIDGVKASDVL